MLESPRVAGFYSLARRKAQKMDKVCANAQNGRKFGEASSEGVQDALKGKQRDEMTLASCKTLA